MREHRIPQEPLCRFAEALLLAGGFTAKEAKDISVSLTLSELMGHGSHGIMRVKEYLGDLKSGRTVSGAKLKIIHETPSSMTIDAQKGVGQTIMPELLERMRAKLSSQAVVTAAVQNSGHIGRIGEWVEKPAYAGYPGLLLVNDNGTFFCVAPPGGKQAVTSTNPVAFAIPLPEGEIFLTDMSTSAIAFGKVKLARLNSKQVPQDSIQDADGNETTDPNALFTNPPGSIMAMGGSQAYKGFALSMFVDLLVSGLSGGHTPPAPEGVTYANNLVLTLWNPEFFSGLRHMQDEAKKYIAFVRASPPTDASKPVRLAGDRMHAVRTDRESEGIPLDEGLTISLINLARELKIEIPKELVR